MGVAVQKRKVSLGGPVVTVAQMFGGSIVSDSNPSTIHTRGTALRIHTKKGYAKGVGYGRVLLSPNKQHGYMNAHLIGLSGSYRSQGSVKIW